jgi:beta-galactosidase/beta-glucuronidase
VASNTSTSISIPNPQLWTAETPTLYNITMSIGGDAATGYFGLRTFT